MKSSRLRKVAKSQIAHQRVAKNPGKVAKYPPTLKISLKQLMLDK